MQLQLPIVRTGCTHYLFHPVVCFLTTKHYVLQLVSILDPNYVILMIARVARLSTAGAEMAYPADAALVGRHGTVSSTTLLFMLLFLLASLLSKYQQVYLPPKKNVLMAWHLLFGKLGKLSSGMRQSLTLLPISILHRSLLVVQLNKLQHAKKKNTPL